MRIVTLKDVGVITSNIAVGLYGGVAISAWSITADYVVGDVRYYAATTPHYVYRCKVAIAHTGSDPIPSSDSTRWELIGTTDRWAMFDDLVGTQSVGVSSVTVDSGKTGFVALYNVDAESVTFTLTVGGVVKKTEVIGLRLPMTSPSWGSYFFEDKVFKDQVIWEYPKYNSGTLSVSLSAPGGGAKCGVMRWGSASQHFATVQKGLSSRLVDYSTKGTVYAVNAGPSADNIDLKIFVFSSEVDAVRKLFRSNIGRAAIYDCSDGGSIDSLVLFALFKDFIRVFDYESVARCNISLQGLI